MTSPSRTPPRFVPTLTTVVERSQELPTLTTVVELSPELPTLTTVVDEPPELPTLSTAADSPRELPTLTSVVDFPPDLLNLTTGEDRPAPSAVIERLPEPPMPTPMVRLRSESVAASENMIDDLGFSSEPEPRPALWQPPAPVVLWKPSPAASDVPPGAPIVQHAIEVSEEEAFRLEDQLLHRVLQRIDLSLEERLTDTVSAAVQSQLDAMLPRLRSEIETVLRSLVVEALAQELSENTGSTPAFRPSTFS